MTFLTCEVGTIFPPDKDRPSQDTGSDERTSRAWDWSQSFRGLSSLAEMYSPMSGSISQIHVTNAIWYFKLDLPMGCRWIKGEWTTYQVVWRCVHHFEVLWRVGGILIFRHILEHREELTASPMVTCEPSILRLTYINFLNETEWEIGLVVIRDCVWSEMFTRAFNAFILVFFCFYTE